ncbi:hypothetical protein L3X38_021304 [Prunus dulcis]|uniref:Eukaryotic translation initiation factor 3 subunit G N-terminal domain-containing protein n=1 Tax=Prunus dulcis TaxID=3755 RepID=A0AAD4Z432_PRUDU|nr:hypothetical protein L3X38_021304 [Prunus dulcis]
MDIVSSLECLKFDSQSEFLYKDSGRKDLVSPAMVPINCETSVIRFKADESEPEEYEDEEFLSDESEAKELIGSNSLESEADESESDELEPRKLIGHECEYCLQVGDHFTQLCPYKFNVPKNAIVSTRCVVLCNRCGCHFRNSCCASCGRRDGCAVIMDCLNCGKKGEHMTYMCPNRKRNSFRSHTVVDDGVVSPLLQIHRPKTIRSKADESEADESETDESETDESETEKLIGHECEYCLKVGDHFTQICPYKYLVPKNAIVSSRNRGEHMTYMCPILEGKPSNFSCDPYTGSCSFN